MKKFLSATTTALSTSVGMLLFAIWLALTALPLIILSLSWWQMLLILFALQILPDIISAPLECVLWIWAFVDTLSHSIDILSVIFYICFLLYGLFFMIPNIYNIIMIIYHSIRGI